MQRTRVEFKLFHVESTVEDGLELGLRRIDGSSNSDVNPVTVPSVAHTVELSLVTTASASKCLSTSADYLPIKSSAGSSTIHGSRDVVYQENQLGDEQLYIILFCLPLAELTSAL